MRITTCTSESTWPTGGTRTRKTYVLRRRRTASKWRTLYDPAQQWCSVKLQSLLGKPKAVDGFRPIN
ncbi:hypothetical protein PsYK624_048430 [Phanerochaete sordida]|uniref:Uncharacterized protein n=1 Tax=Phanerochaete sordida TaxID=48140 RepID=A0A9P3G7A2_9APHY|nr:hypothetical protein PsYK624_048430 [Phanerochaete sordida]